MSSPRLGFLLLVAQLLIPFPVVAQDYHYWTNQYGTQAQLLGGAVVGAVDDLSAAFYNPGGLALSNDPRLALTTDALELTSISIKEGAGPGFDLSSTRFATSPSIFAFRLKLDKESRHSFAFSLVTRFDFDLFIRANRVDDRQTVIDSSGRGLVAGVLLGNSLTEPWPGVSWGYRMTPKLGVGVTGYTAIRSATGDLELNATGLRADSTATSISLADNYTYWNVRGLLKLGILYDLTPISLGMTVTTPSLNLLGSGDLYFLRSGIEIDDDGDGFRQSDLSASSQSELPTTYKSPFSIAAGASYVGKKTGIHFTAEYFTGIAEYALMEPEPFVSQTEGDTIRLSYTTAAAPVLNLGAGLHQWISDRIGLYGGVTSDRSALVPNIKTLISTVGGWDIYHFTGGIEYEVPQISLTFGVAYSRGSDQLKQLIDLSDADEGSGFEGSLEDREFIYERLKFIIGLSVPL